MSHEVETMAYAGDVPWHGLGVPVSNDLTPFQMRQKAGVDWDVYKSPDYIKLASGKFRKSGTFKLIRDSDDAILTTVSDGWEPCLNKEFEAFFDKFVRDGHMEMHTMGSLKDGRIVWALAKINESFELFGGDKVDSYLLFSNPHIYGQSINIRFTPIRVVCWNTLSFSISQSSKNGVTVNHRNPFNAEKVWETLGVANMKLNTYKTMAEFLGKKKATKESIVEYLKQVFPGSKLKNEQEDELRAELSRPARLAYDTLETQPGSESAQGTWWQAFNAVTHTVDHLQGRSTDTRLTSAWYGVGQKRKNVALEKAVDFAEAA